MSDLVRCNNCGAPMTPKQDGRIFRCPFCDAELQVAIDAAQLARGMKLDVSNVEHFVISLASQLRHALPDRTRVHHEGPTIILLEVNLDPHLFLTRRESHGGFTAQYKKLVRGVALKTKTLALDQWATELSTAIAAHANDNARLANVLAQLKGK